ncbi:hypothetical protein C8R42DRAFT_720740 [Lentinula raphanica]|nr:hypothetical protein C8R42DRAFT_720740 [Lentinula raphanica]
MTLPDTFHRNTFQARKLGDSRRTDGQLFSFPILPVIKEDGNTISDDNVAEEHKGDGGTAGTQMPRRKRGPKQRQAKLLKGDEKGQTKKADGWIWSSKLTFGVHVMSGDSAEYEEESDRIQWFRAKEDMERWREVCEKVQAEFRNCIRAFSRMSTEWMKKAGLKEAPIGSAHTSWSVGHAAYARRQAVMYAQLLDECKKTYSLCSFTPIEEDVLFSNKSNNVEDPRTCAIFADTISRIRSEVQAQDDAAVLEQVRRAAETDAGLIGASR